MKSVYENKWTVIAIAIFCAFLWGSAFPVLKMSYKELQIAASDTSAQMVFAGMRFLLAGLLILAFKIMTNRKQLRVQRSQIPVLILLGIFQTAIQYYLFYIGLSKVSGIQGSILSSVGTFFAVLLAHFFYKNDRLNWKKSVGLCLGFTGIIAANWGQELHFQFQFTGEGFLILSGLASAIAAIMSKEMSNGIHPITLTGWQLTIGSVILMIIGMPQMSDDAITFTPLGWGLLIYAALISSFAFALWTSLLKFNKAGEISIYNFLIPIFGGILSAILIPEEQFNAFILSSHGLSCSWHFCNQLSRKRETSKSD